MYDLLGVGDALCMQRAFLLALLNCVMSVITPWSFFHKIEWLETISHFCDKME